jgi:hypothetical protein
MIETEVNLGRLRGVIKLSSRNYYSICLWCTSNFGPEANSRDQVDENHRWMTTCIFGDDIFYFAKEEDATWFKLRWLGEQGN